MPTISQDARICQLKTPFSKDTLALVEFSGSEHVNEINLYHVRALAESLIDSNKLIGEAVEILIALPDGGSRYVHLVCFGTRYLGGTAGGHLYEFELRPWFWMMNYKVNSRIFHELSVKDILAKMFQEYSGVAGGKFLDKTTGTSVILEYTVQYNESDLNFCRRLMEHHGINFHVEMNEGEHTLVMTTDGRSFPAALGGTVKYSPEDQSQYTDLVVLNRWHPRRQMASHSLRMTDYNYDLPTTSMEAIHSLPFTHDGPELEHFTYPGGYQHQGAGTAIARRRLEALRTHDHIVFAEGLHGTFGAGMVFELSTHDDDPGQQGKYIVLSSTSSYTSEGYRSGGSGGMSFRSSFVLTKENSPVAPAQITPRPRITGPQTAVVTKGAETGDSMGRIEVRFHWKHEDHSILARVSQMWAGSSWGTVFVPRVDMEVLVEFLEGDPDRPIITGCVYTADNMPPWDGTNEKEISGIKSQTMHGGGYNEISINDKPGAEDIIIHAQKDMHTTVEADEFAEILGNSKRDTTGTETITVTGACVIESMQSIELKVGGNSIKIDMTGIKIKGMQIDVSADAKLSTKGLLVEHKGDGPMTIQAPLIKIN
jgi:type VI secretion system secreted protein VgrG